MKVKHVAIYVDADNSHETITQPILIRVVRVFQNTNQLTAQIKLDCDNQTMAMHLRLTQWSRHQNMALTISFL